MVINLQLLTNMERSSWDRLEYGRAMESDLRAILYALCVARQAAQDALEAINAACEDDAINGNREIGRAVAALYPQTFGLRETESVARNSAR